MAKKPRFQRTDDQIPSHPSSPYPPLGGGSGRFPEHFIFPEHLRNKVNTAALIDLAITETKIADDSISAPKIQANAVTANEIAANTITANEIAANTITAAEIAAGTITATEITVTSLSSLTAAMGTLTSGIIQNATSNPTKAIVFSGSVPGTADSFIDFTVGTGAGEIFMQVNSERLRIFGDGSLTTHGILKGYALHTESGEGGAGGVAYLTGVTVLGNNAYMQSHKQGSTTILGSNDEDMLEVDSGSFFLRGKAATWGRSLMAILGDYSVSTAGFTEVTDTWASGDDPDGTADGKNSLTLPSNGTKTVTAGNRLAIPVVLAGTPAYDGKYTLVFTLHHDCTNYTEPSLPVPDGDSLVSTLTIEANVNGAGYSDVGSVVFGTLVDGTTAELQYSKEVDIGNTSPTSVTFRLKLSTTMQIDPDNLSGNIFTHVRVYTTTGIGTDPEDVLWLKTTGSVQNRRGVQLLGVDAGADVIPHVNLDKESFSAVPADGDGVEGDLIYVSGAVKKLQYHDGTSWNQLEAFSGNADTLDSLDSTYFLNAGNLNAGTLLDARVAQSNVTQHQAALALAASQVTSGTFANARISQASVTQHEAALTILESQITDGSILARVAGTESISGAWTFTTQPTLDYGDTLSSKVAGYTIQNGAPTSEDYPEGTLWLDTSAASALDLGDLADVTITSIASGEMLKWNGTAWINQTLAELDFPTLSGTNVFSGACSFTNNDVEISGYSPRLSLIETDGDNYKIIVSASRLFFKNTSDAANVEAFWRTSNNTDWMRFAGNSSGYLLVSTPHIRLENSANYLSITQGDATDGGAWHVRGSAGSEEMRLARVSSAHAWEATMLSVDLVGGDVTISGDIFPSSDAGGSLGTSSRAWHELYVRDITSDSGAALLFWSGGQTAEVARIQTNNNWYHRLGLRAQNQDKGAKSAAFTIDPRDGVKQFINLTNSSSIAMTWAGGSVQAGSVLILTIRRGSNSGAMTFPNDIDWGTQGVPTIPTTAGQAITVVLYAHSASEWQGAEYGEGGYTLADI